MVDGDENRGDVGTYADINTYSSAKVPCFKMSIFIVESSVYP